MNSRMRLAKSGSLVSVVAILLAVASAGCRTSYGDGPYTAIAVPSEKTRAIDTLDLSAMSAPAGEPETPVAAPLGSTEVSLTLDQARAAALAHNLDIKVALIDPAISAESINQEEARFEALFFSQLGYTDLDSPSFSDPDAGKLETVSADPGVQVPLKTGGTVTLDVPMTRFTSPLAKDYSTGFSASIIQPLLRGAGVRANTHAIRVACYSTKISEAQTKLEVIRVIAAADRVYWRLYAAKRALTVRRNEYDLAVAQLERARRRVAAGAASEVEVIRAETGVGDSTETVIVAENAVRQRERDLKRTLNIPGLAVDTTTVVIPATEPDPVRYDLDNARLVKAALDNRMEMLSLELQIAQDLSSIDFQRNAALPLLALDYTYNVNGIGETLEDSVDLLTDKRFEDHSLGLRLEVPLGNRAARSRLHQAIYTRVQRLATREARRLQIQQEVLDAADQLKTNWQRVLANRQRAVLASRNLDAEVRQFELGLRTSTDVFQAQTRLGDAQLAEITSLTEYQIAQVDLAFATGTLLGAAKVHWQPTVPPANSK